MGTNSFKGDLMNMNAPILYSKGVKKKEFILMEEPRIEIHSHGGTKDRNTKAT